MLFSYLLQQLELCFWRGCSNWQQLNYLRQHKTSHVKYNFTDRNRFNYLFILKKKIGVFENFSSVLQCAKNSQKLSSWQVGYFANNTHRMTILALFTQPFFWFCFFYKLETHGYLQKTLVSLSSYYRHSIFIDFAGVIWPLSAVRCHWQKWHLGQVLDFPIDFLMHPHILIYPNMNSNYSFLQLCFCFPIIEIFTLRNFKPMTVITQLYFSLT